MFITYFEGHILVRKAKRHTTKVFAKAGLDNLTAAICYYQQWFALDFYYSALGLNFNFIFSFGHWYRADEQ